MNNKLIDAYSSMYLLRRAEEEIANHYFENKIFSFVHFYIGQEAVAVGVSSGLTKGDRVFGNHRSHGHYLAKGGNLFAMYSEMLGKSTGCCGGYGGSMHMLDRSVNFLGTTPILGSIAPIAAGSAFQQRMQNNNEITVFYIGDGASEEGVFYETINFAALMKLPLLIVVENNLYSVNSPKEARKPQGFNLATVAAGMGIPFFKADGNDFHSVSKTTEQAVNSIKIEKKPAIIECEVFRHMAHSAPIRDDKSGYRIIDTEQERFEKDSVLNLRAELATSLGETEVLKIEYDIDAIVGKALVEAIAAPMPIVTDLTKKVFA